MQVTDIPVHVQALVWESTHPVAYDLMQLNSAEHNHQIYKKDTQHNLSRWQLQWLKFMSQYEMNINYSGQLCICR